MSSETSVWDNVEVLQFYSLLRISGVNNEEKGKFVPEFLFWLLFTFLRLRLILLNNVTFRRPRRDQKKRTMLERECLRHKNIAWRRLRSMDWKSSLNPELLSDLFIIYAFLAKSILLCSSVGFFYC